MPTPVLDWRPSEDPRNADWPIAPTLRANTPLLDREWRPGPVLDQGREGACVGFAHTSDALGDPIPVDLTRLRAYAPTDPNLFALFVYGMARYLDEWPGETYAGTSTNAGAKAMKNLGLINEWRWATTTQDILTTLSQKSGVVMGSWWRQDMYSPKNGVLRPTGNKVGGHAWYLHRYANSVPVLGGEAGVRVKNSWGTSWGEGGFAWLSVSDLHTLFMDDGEACVVTSRSYGR